MSVVIMDFSVMLVAEEKTKRGRNGAMFVRRIMFRAKDVMINVVKNVDFVFVMLRLEENVLVVLLKGINLQWWCLTSSPEILS